MPINAAASLISPNSIPFEVTTKKIKYLGIWATHNYKDLYKANLLPLIEGLKRDIKRWDLLPLSLSGRINTIKMNVLPKFLYLFQNLPIFLTKYFFNSIDKLVSVFIWNNKNPWIRKSVLQKPRTLGGMALPNFMFYYWAANIRGLTYWMRYNDSSDTPKWLNLEKISCKSVSLSSLICSELPMPEPASHYSSNPIVSQSLKIWNQFRKSFALRSLSLCAPLSKNLMFTPSILDKPFNIWVKSGICTLQDLYMENTYLFGVCFIWCYTTEHAPEQL